MEDEEEEEQECIWTMDARRRLLAPRRIIIIIISLSLSLILFLCAKVFRVIRAVQKSERGVLERFPLVWNGEKSRGFKFTLFVATF